jgi:hypothetical protein
LLKPKSVDIYIYRYILDYVRERGQVFGHFGESWGYPKKARSPYIKNLAKNIMKNIKWFGPCVEFDKEWKCWVAILVVAVLAIIAG